MRTLSVTRACAAIVIAAAVITAPGAASAVARPKAPATPVSSIPADANSGRVASWPPHHTFQWPTGVAIDSVGSVLVADRNNGRIARFDASGALLEELRPFGGTALPRDVAVTCDGRIVVADQSTDRVVMYATGSRSPMELTAIDGDPCLGAPRGLACGPLGEVFVLDACAGRVLRFDRDGRNVAAFDLCRGACGDCDARDLAIDGQGLLYVTDAASRRIDCYDRKGARVRSVALPAACAGTPAGLAVDGKGRLFVGVLGPAPAVAVLGPRGSLIATIGAADRKGTPFLAPRALAVLGSTLWVCDSDADTVYRFELAR